MDRHQLIAKVRGADLLIDVMGYLQCDEVSERVRRTLFLDIDPGFTQMWCDLGLHNPFGHHDVYATVGENIGRPGCHLPTCDIDWIVTRPPVVLALWPVRLTVDRRLTSVCTWRGPYDPVQYGDTRYGLRAHGLRRLAQLPHRVAGHLELALDIDADDAVDRRTLLDNGWHLVDPIDVAGDPMTYRRYIQESAGELMVAKDMYVRSRSGWFSDRSACYLATGKPVVAEDTGLDALYPIGKGLVTYSDLDGAADSIACLWEDYSAHVEAARALAETAFDSDRVLVELIGRAGL
jgi:hypothetical protein